MENQLFNLRFASRRLVGATILLVASLLSTFEASAAPLVITKKNIKQFKEIDAKERFACFNNRRGSIVLGVLDKRPIRVGRTWEKRDVATTRRLRDRLTQDIRKARGQKRAQLQRELKVVIRQLGKVEYFTEQCNPSAPSAEFSGQITSLAPYKSKLTRHEASHLLKKVAFGGSSELILLAQTSGLDALVDRLLSEPVDTQTWRDALRWGATELGTVEETGERYWYTYPLQLAAAYEAIFSPSPFRTRMALLVWHPHFATNLSRVDAGFSGDGIHSKNHYELIRRNALGNFLELARGMVNDVAMNRWLNNEDNHVGAPNQNFAREYLELFTLGLVDPVTQVKNYDERTIDGATAAFSGFTVNYDLGVRRILFDEQLRDTDPYVVFPGILGAERTQSFTVDGFMNHIAYNHPGAARYLAERLFAQLVSPNVPANIVNELAQDILAHHYDLAPVLRKILRSEAMFSVDARRVCVASPFDQAVTLLRRFDLPPLRSAGEELDRSKALLWYVVSSASDAGQSLFEPPSVFGWKGSCGINREARKHFGEGFLSEQNVLKRVSSAVNMLNVVHDQGVQFKSLLPNQSMEPRQIIKYFADRIYDLELSEAQLTILISFLNHVRDENGNTVEQPFSLSDQWYAQRKLQQLLALLSELSDSQRE